MEQLSLDRVGRPISQAEPEAVLATLVEEDNDAILVELCDRLEQGVGVRISRATMGRIVQKLKLTRKKLCTQLRHSKNTAVKSAVLAEAVNLADLVFVDETGSNLSMTRHARALKGDRAYSDAPYQRGNNLTLIGAMALGTRWRNDLAWSHRCTGLQDLCVVLKSLSGACGHG